MSNIKEKAEQYARELYGDSKLYDEETENAISDYIAGYNEAMSQPKHIFDGAAAAGEVRRFEGDLVDVVDENETCEGCILEYRMPICDYLTGCEINNVKYVKQ